MDMAVRGAVIVDIDWCSCPFEYICTTPCKCPAKPARFPNTAIAAAAVVTAQAETYHARHGAGDLVPWSATP